MKIALITGGSRGLGKSMALNAAAKGHDIILTYHSNQTEANNVVAEIGKLGRKAVALQLDVSQSKSFDGFASSIREVLSSQWQRNDFDYLVNNAGIGINASIAATTEDQFDTLVDIHFKGPFFLTQKLLPLIKDGGRIINISSGLARFSMPGYSVYGSLKAAMEAMTRYQAQELGVRGISVNVVAPGAIETDFGGGFVRDNKDINKAISSQTALGRVGQPDDIGGVVASLLTEDTKWINGQRIEVAGGYLL